MAICFHDAYSQKSTTVGERIPDAEAAIKQKIQDGALIVNYIGHGGETGWAHEQILTIPTIQNWDNSKSMSVFMTATCEFGRFDDHDRVSAGEYVLLNKNGGGIGLFTTTRLVYALPNEYLKGTYVDTIQSSFGCDSIVTLDLIILGNTYKPDPLLNELRFFAHRK